MSRAGWPRSGWISVEKSVIGLREQDFARRANGPYIAAMTTHSTRMLILGSGPAGLLGGHLRRARRDAADRRPGHPARRTADHYDRRRELSRLRGRHPGPVADGADAEAGGARRHALMWDTIIEVDLTRRPFRLIGDGGDVYGGEVLVIATGAQAKWLGLPSEDAMKGKGVSACATCDGFFYRGKKVAVIGGGNTAVEEALYLTNHSDDVTLIHRRDLLRAERILQERLFAHPNITVLWNKEVREFVDGGGNAGLVALDLEDTVTGEHSRLDVEGGFVRDRASPGDRVAARAPRA
ncbi:NAD(P)/FAD-dependent oxidoreductase [Sphingomonas sp. MMS24-JH45]